MVAREHDDGVVGEAEALEGVEDLSDLRVHERDGRGVSLNGFDGAGRRSSSPVPRTRCDRRLRACAIGRRGRLGQLDAIERVHVEVPFGRDVGRMRPVEPDGQKERFRVVRLNRSSSLNRFGGGNPVSVLGIGPIVGKPADRCAELSRAQREDPVVNLAIAAARVDGEVPGGEGRPARRCRS